MHRNNPKKLSPHLFHRLTKSQSEGSLTSSQGIMFLSDDGPKLGFADVDKTNNKVAMTATTGLVIMLQTPDDK